MPSGIKPPSQTKHLLRATAKERPAGGVDTLAVSAVPATPSPRWAPALIVIGAGVCAALHIGKLPPAITALREALGLTLLQAGFLLSLVQGAGMLAGLAFGVLADGLGTLRSMVIGLLLLALASAAGGLAGDVPTLLWLRALEGAGFLLVVLPAPGLVRQLAPPGRAPAAMGLWGAYMPLATALALLLGPLCIGTLGWRAWWWLLGGVSAVMAAVLMLVVQQPTVVAAAQQGFLQRLRLTLSAPGPWLVALCFAVYSGQWLAVIGFLPVIYTQAGVSAAATGVLTACAAAANMIGNIVSGRLLQRGVAPGRLLHIGYLTMALGAAATFAGADGAGLPPALRYAAVLLFSAVGGLIPATLFALAVRVAPGPQTLSSTVGWVQQWSALGQFAGPPLVAWLAGRAGGWQFTWLATGACSMAGLLLVVLLTRLLARGRTAA
jgi:MFS transporter, CP family, cyanate transporter